MLPLSKDEQAEVQVEFWREAVRATPESIHAAMLTQLAVKSSAVVSIYRSDRFVMEASKWRAGYTLRAMSYDTDKIIRKVWRAAPPTYQGGGRLSYFEMIFQPKNGKFFAFDDTLSLMVAFVDGGVAACPHKWLPEHSE